MSSVTAFTDHLITKETDITIFHLSNESLISVKTITLL